jgi:DMSO/TMAO reductase YedYZ molybdopterin-dependent catalytic subunit
VVAGILGAPPPLEPLAALVMEWTPVPIANALLDLLGAFGKPLALWGAAAIVLAVSGPLALLASARRLGRLRWPLAAAAAALLAWPLARPGAALGIGVLLALFLVALGWLDRRPAHHPKPAGRRQFLRAAAGNITAVGLVSLLPLAAASARAALLGRSVRPALFAYTPPAARSDGFVLAGLTPEVTAVPAFYVMSKNVADPVVDETVWSLTLSGRVARTVSLTLDELAALPRTDQYVTMQCVSNPVGGPLWSAALFSGVSLAELLRRADPLPDAGWVSFEAPDGHREQLPLERARDPLVLVAYGMNGAWLDPAHGFPVRLLATGLYGFRSVKWLSRIELLADPRPGHWEERNWTAAAIHTTARVDVVQRGPDGGLAAGVAFAGVRGVSAVEARVNGGPWRPARLHTPPLSGAMWVQWRVNLDLPSGEARVEARAVDGRGVPQDETARGQFPNGATGLHGVVLRG